MSGKKHHEEASNALAGCKKNVIRSKRGLLIFFLALFVCLFVFALAYLFMHHPHSRKMLSGSFSAK